VSGFDLLADELRLDEVLEGADLVITAEGFLDEGSFDGKVVGGVAGLAGVLGVPVLATVSLRASTARAIDAGVLPTRLPDALARPVRQMLRRVGALDHEQAA